MAERAAAALRSEHRKRGLPSPTENPSVVDLLKGISNIYGRPPRPVRPLTKRMLRRMLEGLTAQKPSILAMRTAWLALISFQITGRCGDIKRLEARDFVFTKDGSINIKFKRMKNVSVRRGFQVIMTPQNHRWCPVACTKNYFQKLGLSGRDVVLPVIYKRVSKGTVSFSVRKSAQASNASLRLHFRDALRAVGLDATDFGLHSPRRGSAQALLEGGFSAASINTRVGWRSPNMLGRYTCDSSVLQASQSAFLADLS